MKKLLIYLTLLPFSIHAKDSLSDAITKSDPDIVRAEIKKRMVSNKPISQQEVLFYLDLCQEVVTRRRNAVQFPSYVVQQPHYYYYGSQPVPYYTSSTPVYTKAYANDADPEVSVNCALRCGFGLIGTIGSLIYWCNSMGRFYDEHNTTLDITVFALGLTSIISFVSALNEVEANKKQYQEKLYENAIQIKHLIYNIEAS